MKSYMIAVCFFLLAGMPWAHSAEPVVAGHKTKSIEGWTVFVSDRLGDNNQAATERALELLAIQLQEIVRVVPAAAVVELRKVPLWFSPEYLDVSPRAEYHPGAAWLRENNRDPAMEKAVEFTNVRIFERETKRMPNFALHELAHAYHDRVLPNGFGNEPIKAMFNKAKTSGLYDRVEQRFGDGRSEHVRAYAITNPMEYFAECSESFFSTNDFFPFNREQLGQYDSEMFSLLKKLWEVPIVAVANPQQAVTDPATLTLERIFASEEFVGEKVPNVKWLDAGSYTMLQPSPNNQKMSDLVRVDATGKRVVLISAEQLLPTGATEPLVIENYELSKDLDLALIYTNSVKVWRQNTRGDYWTFRRSTGQLAKLGGDAEPSTLMFAKLSPDGSRVGYVHENNVLVEPVESGQQTKLTSDGSQEVINGTFDWVYEEEFGCRDGWRWSPDGQHIAYWQLNTSGVKKFTLVDNTTENYPVLKSFAYPKTGEQNSACRLGVVSVAIGPTNWIEIPGDTRTDFYVPRMQWDSNSRELWVQRVNRLQNAVDVMQVDVSTGKVQIVSTERDSAWVDVQDEDVMWVQGGNAFAWTSERDGWRHLYLISRNGTLVRQVTKGEFDVIRVLHIDEKTDRVFLLASPDNTTQQYLYSTPLIGSGSLERLTPRDEPGWHDYSIALDGVFAVHTHSSFGKPPRTTVVSLPDHHVVNTLAANEALRVTVEQLSQAPVEFLQVDIGAGVKLDGWLMKPKDFDPAKKYPLVFHVYGEPAGQSVLDRWGDKKYLWHLMLTQQGYVVACVDNRGTPSPRGREWRKAAYRRIGTLASEEQSAAARELLKRPYLDETRVGVWGWSGGGSMTLNLLFRYPELYGTGMSVAAVPDMRLYDTIYQERYMGLPQSNADYYQQGSPITHAAGLQGNLLVVHGSGDDNCHIQGMEKLVDRLIELNKPFTMMAYPNRSHSINEGKTTNLHLYGLLTRYLNSNLSAGAKP